MTDAIPADIKITDVSWPGKGDSAVFPNWESCEVTGQNASGYGGNARVRAVRSAAAGRREQRSVRGADDHARGDREPGVDGERHHNVAVVDYHTFGHPEDPGRDSDDATVTLSTLPATGGEPGPAARDARLLRCSEASAS